MILLSPRARRVLGALTDLNSYRLLYSSLTSRLISPERSPPGSAGVGEFGLPEVELFDAGKRIPAIIFQTWKSHSDMPANYRYWRGSFIRNNPGFRCLLWDDADNLQFIERKFPWFLDRYKSYAHEIFRADMVRLFFLYLYGGFYADMDSECLRPLDQMRDMGDVLLGRMGRDHSFEHSIPNAIMASRSRQSFWLLAIAFAVDRLEQSRTDARPEWLTGPVLLKDTVDFYMSHSRQQIRETILRLCPEFSQEVDDSCFGSVRLLPPAVWYPLNWNNFIQTIVRKKMFREKGVLGLETARRIFPRAFIVTYWSASWK